MKKRIVILICSLLFVVYVVALFIKLFSEPGTYGLYKQLRIGMSRSEVQTLFGDSADYICQYKDYDIWYYSDHGFATRTSPNQKFAPNHTFKDVDKLPDTFGHITFAFNQEGKVYAYTWIGETTTVEYEGGSVGGSHFRKIPPSNF